MIKFFRRLPCGSRRLPPATGSLAGIASALTISALILATATYAAAHNPSGMPRIAARMLPHPGRAVVHHPPTTALAAVSFGTGSGQRMQAAIRGPVPDAQVGIEVVDTTTGAVLASQDPGRQFCTASVAKLLIALDTLKSKGWQPDPGTQSKLQQMLSTSDDDVADDLWNTGGGTAIVDRMIDDIGLTGTRPPTDPDQWGETLTTAADVVTMYHHITTAIPAPARDLIVNALRAINPTAADGTDQYFGIPDALPNTSWAVKQGWMTTDSTIALNTTGLVDAGPGQPLRYAVVVLSSQPGDTDWGVGRSALTAGVQQLRGTLV